jgi:hypothetical protein
MVCGREVEFGMQNKNITVWFEAAVWQWYKRSMNLCLILVLIEASRMLVFISII